MDLFIGWASTWNAQKDDEIKEFPPTTKPIRYLPCLESDVFHEPNCFVEPSGGGGSYFFFELYLPVLSLLPCSRLSRNLFRVSRYQAPCLISGFLGIPFVLHAEFHFNLDILRVHKNSCIRHRSVIIVMRRPKRETLTALCRNQITHLNPVPSLSQCTAPTLEKIWLCVVHLVYSIGWRFFCFFVFLVNARCTEKFTARIGAKRVAVTKGDK